MEEYDANYGGCVYAETGWDVRAGSAASSICTALLKL
jgi:hypothetical protein